MKKERLDRVIDVMVRIPPIMHRKVHRTIFKATLDEMGREIAVHHLMIMKVLRESGVMHIKEISEITGIAKPQMTHSIDRLIDQGLVERQPDTEDRRRINIRLTGKGRDTLQRLDEILQDRMKERLSTLSDEELEGLARAFEYIAETFSKLQ